MKALIKNNEPSKLSLSLQLFKDSLTMDEANRYIFKVNKKLNHDKPITREESNKLSICYKYLQDILQDNPHLLPETNSVLSVKNRVDSLMEIRDLTVKKYTGLPQIHVEETYKDLEEELMEMQEHLEYDDLELQHSYYSKLWELRGLIMVLKDIDKTSNV
jgi:Rad3-related DNA helicase